MLGGGARQFGQSGGRVQVAVHIDALQIFVQLCGRVDGRLGLLAIVRVHLLDVELFQQLIELLFFEHQILFTLSHLVVEIVQLFALDAGLLAAIVHLFSQLDHFGTLVRHHALVEYGAELVLVVQLSLQVQLTIVQYLLLALDGLVQLEQLTALVSKVLHFVDVVSAHFGKVAIDVVELDQV
ncbi:hypothetical protein BpHYR1_046931 [Brachionus plicatilis]|uniref:Uncharacterized protein n=1 Tax=Brachionus plicatilis TaxID=10195 RepID=A0A3M7RGG9_BRAPC|nr:hypothetical protein BpHYR1_046931 [Brachionus plicatilis]